MVCPKDGNIADSKEILVDPVRPPSVWVDTLGGCECMQDAVGQVRLRPAEAGEDFRAGEGGHNEDSMLEVVRCVNNYFKKKKSPHPLRGEGVSP